MLIMQIKTLAISLSMVLLILSNAGHSQSLPTRPNLMDAEGNKNGAWIYYYDEDWNPIEDATNALFYRLITYKAGKPIGEMADYYGNGQIQMSVESVINEDPLEFDGMLAEYSKEGNIVLVEFRKNGIMDTATTIRKFRQLINTYQQKKPNHLDLAYTANNLAYLYREQPQYDSAEIFYNMAKEIREVELGTSHVIYANSCNKLGYVLIKQNKFEQAEPLYKISMQVHGQTLGEESDYYKNARGNLAFIYMQTQRYDLAETLYKEAINAHLNTEDKNDRSYRYNCFQLARVYAKLNQRDKALSFYLEAKNITEISEEHADWFEELLK